MKFILMVLLLFILTDPVLANPGNNTSECLRMYDGYINDYGSSQYIPTEKMHTFITKCLPADYFNTPVEYDKTQNNDADTKTITIKT